MAEWEPKSAAAYTAEEKAKAFDKLHKMALEHYRTAEQEGNTDGDDEHYMYEAVMELLGKGVWQKFNTFLR